MMKLTTMHKFVATVNADWESPVANEIAVKWGSDSGTVKFFRASANFVCRFQKDSQTYFLRFNHADERRVEEIAGEIAYLKYLAAQGITLANPIPSLTGKEVESVLTSLGTYHAVVFEALPGKEMHIEDMDDHRFPLWGKALGELHRASQQYKQANRPTWQDHLHLVAEILTKNEDVARKELAFLQPRIQDFPIQDQNFGLIHFDFELDNLIWDGNRPGIIDFDDCAWYWFGADIAFALRDLFADRADQVDFEQKALLAFLDGYRLAKPLDPETVRQIPLFLRLHNLFMFARLIRSLGDGGRADEPPWLAQLRQKLSRKLDDYRHGFARYLR
jgi:Ser/Thr protein kinase RdoA (MazF antagonist)